MRSLVNEVVTAGKVFDAAQKGASVAKNCHDALKTLSPATCTALATLTGGYGWLIASLVMVAFVGFEKLNEKNSDEKKKSFEEGVLNLINDMKPLLEEANKEEELKEMLRRRLGVLDQECELGGSALGLTMTCLESKIEESAEETTKRILDTIGEPEIARIQNLYAKDFASLPYGMLRRCFAKDLVDQQQKSALTTILEKIETDVALKLNLDVPVPILGREVEARPARFIFSERLVSDLIGREREFEMLREFRDRPESVVWWCVEAVGGMGKSRLALEFLYDTLNLGWVAGFLKGGFPKPEELQKLPTDQNYLFIIDYAASHVDSVREALVQFKNMEALLGKKKIRVLLLERSFRPKDEWVKKLCVGEASVEKTRVRHCCHGKDYSGNATALTLGALGLNAFVETFEIAYYRLAQRRLSPDDIDRITEVFKSPEFEKRRRRPLYACLSAAVVEKRGADHVEDWKSDDLEEFVLGHEEKIWTEQLRPSQEDVHAVFVATMMDGVQERDWDVWPDSNLLNCNEATARSVASHTPNEDKVIPAIEPDLIGEAFVRMRLRGVLYNEGQSATVSRDSKRIWEWLSGGGKEVNGRLSDQTERFENFLIRAMPSLIRDDFVRAWLLRRINCLSNEILRAMGLAQTLLHGAEREELCSALDETGQGFGAAVEAGEIEQAAIAAENSGQVQRHVMEVLDSLDVLDLHERMLQFSLEELIAFIDWAKAIRAQAASLRLNSDTIRPYRTLEALTIILAHAYVRNGQLSLAGELCGQALHMARLLLIQLGENPMAIRDVQIALTLIGDILSQIGKLEEALEHYSEAREMSFRNLKSQNKSIEPLRDIATNYDRTGDIFARRDNLNEALDYYEQSLKFRKRIRKLEGSTPTSLREQAVSLNKIGDVLSRSGQYMSALQNYRESLAISRSVRKMVGETPNALRDISVCLENIGDILGFYGETDKALEHFVESLTLCKKQLILQNDTPEALRDYSACLDRIGAIHLNAGDFSGARTFFEESRDISIKLRTRMEETPQALRDVMTTTYRLSLVSPPPRQRALAEEALEIAERLARDFPTPQAKAELDMIRAYLASVQ